MSHIFEIYCYILRNIDDGRHFTFSQRMLRIWADALN